MERGAAILQNKLSADVETFFERFDSRVALDQLLGVVGEEFFDQRRNIGIVIVEGVARDTAVVCDILDRDAVDRLFIEQLDKRLFDRFLREL